MAAEAQDIASFSIHYPNSLRFLSFPDEIVVLIRDVITRSWDAGVQKESDNARAVELKLKGWPWWADNIPAKKLLCRLFEFLHNHGWTLLTISSPSLFTSGMWAVEQIYFEYQAEVPPPRSWMSVSFGKVNSLRFCDTPSDTLHALVAALRNESSIHGPAKSEPACYEFKLSGQQPRGLPKDHTVNTVRMMTLLQALRRNGWQVDASINTSLLLREKASIKQNDLWICSRSADWDPSQSPDFQQASHPTSDD